MFRAGALRISVLGTKEGRRGLEPPKDVKGLVKAALAQHPSEGLPLHSKPDRTLKRRTSLALNRGR